MSSGFLIYADNEPKSVPARDLGDCRSQVIVIRNNIPKLKSSFITYNS